MDETLTNETRERIAKKCFLETVRSDRFLNILGIADDSIPEEEDIAVVTCVDKGDGIMQACVEFIDIPFIGIITYDSLSKWADVHLFKSLGGKMIYNVE